MIERPPKPDQDALLRKLSAQSWPANDRDEAAFAGVLRDLVDAQRNRVRHRRVLVGVVLVVAAIAGVWLARF